MHFLSFYVSAQKYYSLMSREGDNVTVTQVQGTRIISSEAKSREAYLLERKHHQIYQIFNSHLVKVVIIQFIVILFI